MGTVLKKGTTIVSQQNIRKQSGQPKISFEGGVEAGVGGGGVKALEEYFSFIERIIHQWWAKTGEPREKTPDHP